MSAQLKGGVVERRTSPKDRHVPVYSWPSRRPRGSRWASSASARKSGREGGLSSTGRLLQLAKLGRRCAHRHSVRSTAFVEQVDVELPIPVARSGDARPEVWDEFRGNDGPLGLRLRRGLWPGRPRREHPLDGSSRANAPSAGGAFWYAGALWAADLLLLVWFDGA